MINKRSGKGGRTRVFGLQPLNGLHDLEMPRTEHTSPDLFFSARRRAVTRGYTLVEMLLATALSASLLLALWSMFSIYTNLFEKGQSRVEQAQLCRALMQQISDDLHAAVQDPIGGTSTETPGSVPVRRFGLSGSQHELRFDVLQVTPQQGNPVPAGNWQPAMGEVSIARVPELRTIYYEFSDPVLFEGTDDNSPTGLIRRELDFETPVGQADEQGFVDSAFATDSLGGLAGGDEALPGTSSNDPVDTSVVWVPEVVGVEFRYFDGNAWTGAWSSLQRKSLPVAVEVTLRMADSDAADPNQPLADDEVFSDREIAEAQEPPFRVVVDLPGSPSYRKPRPPRPTTTRPRPRVPVRRIAPPRRQPTRPPVRIAPEEWIRTQSR